MDAADVGALAVELEEADENDDLELRVRGQRIPLVRRATGGSDVGVPFARTEETMLPKIHVTAGYITSLAHRWTHCSRSIARTKSRR